MACNCKPICVQDIDWLATAGDQVGSAGEPRIIWSLTNQQEPRWTYAQVSFVPDAPYLLTFEGIRASDVRGIIGIDDVTLFPSACSIKPSKASVASGDCSFEFDTCGWKSINPGSALDLRPQDWKLADRIQETQFSHIKFFASPRDHLKSEPPLGFSIIRIMGHQLTFLGPPLTT